MLLSVPNNLQALIQVAVNASVQVCPNTNQTSSLFSSATTEFCTFDPTAASLSSAFSIVLLSTGLERGRRDLDAEVSMQACVSVYYKNLCVCVCMPWEHIPSHSVI